MAGRGTILRVIGAVLSLAVIVITASVSFAYLDSLYQNFDFSAAAALG